MAQTADQNFNEFKYGAVIQTQNIQNGTIKGSNVALATIAGANLTTSFGVNIYRAATTGQVPNTVFYTGSTAPVQGTVIGFFASPSAGAGTITLWGTTAGTIAQLPFNQTGSAVGLLSATGAINSAVASGDSLQVSSITNAGTATGYVIFQSNV